MVDINAQGWDDTLICSNLPFFTATLTADVAQDNLIPTYTYQWYFEGTLIPGATQYSLTVNQEGTYSVEVTNPQGCTVVRVVEVNSSVIATIDSVTVVDLVDNNTITVNVSGNGDYVYSIDESYGPYQSSNVFTQVPMGVHTVYVKDLNGCGIASYLVTVLGIPAYFTPNGDGFNDTWNIRGVTNTFYPNTQIFIYDRYGKLLKQIGALGPGWDGTYNGALLPGDDYWYVIQLEDGRIVKGNFALKR